MACLRPLLAVVLAGLALAACGSASRTRTDTSAGSGSSLTVAVRAKAGGPVVRTVRIACDGAAPAAACARLAAAPGLLVPIGAGERCTQIYGGSAVATITGTFAGRPVDLTVTRADGCNIERWARLVTAGAIPADAGSLGAPVAPAATTPAAGAVTASLQVDVWPQGVRAGATHKAYTLACGPTAGDLPDADSTCANLAAVPDLVRLFAAPDPHRECPRGTAGNAVAAVRGEIGGRAVHLTSSLANGCETVRFARLRGIGLVPAADVPGPLRGGVS